jgi:hypothetical protein
MKPTVQLFSSGSGIGPVLAGAAMLQKSAVYVGIPEKTAARKKGAKINNAQLAFLLTNGVRDSSMRRIVMAKQQKHRIGFDAATKMYLRSHGSPLWQAPPRPMIEPAIEAKDNNKAITDELQKAAEAALDGRIEDCEKGFNRAGLTGQNVVRAWFTDSRNGWPPNAPSTIARKGSSRPNIDTDQLRKAMTYVTTFKPVRARGNQSEGKKTKKVFDSEKPNTTGAAESAC